MEDPEICIDRLLYSNFWRLNNEKRIFAALLASAMTLSFAACSTESSNGNNSAELEDTLVIYTTHSEEMLDVIANAFTEKTGVEVESINLKGELADRVRSEKDNPQADIMFGGDTATYMLLQEEGCYEATKPTWADLADAAYADKIVTRDSLSSSMRSTICSLIAYNAAQNGEDAAWSYIESLSGNTKNFYNSGSMMFQAVGKGEAAISMAVINDVITNRDKNEMPLEMVIPESGAVVITDCIAAIKDAPHPNAAAAFIEFVGGAEGQLLTAKEFNRMPVLESVLADCPEWMQTAFSVLDVDWNEISANQSAWLEKWETNYVDAAKTVAKS